MLNIYFCYVPNVYAVGISLKNHIADLFVKHAILNFVPYFK